MNPGTPTASGGPNTPPSVQVCVVWLNHQWWSRLEVVRKTHSKLRLNVVEVSVGQTAASPPNGVYAVCHGKPAASLSRHQCWSIPPPPTVASISKLRAEGPL